MEPLLATVWTPAGDHDVSLMRRLATSAVGVSVDGGSDEMQSWLTAIRVHVIVLLKVAHCGDV